MNTTIDFNQIKELLPLIIPIVLLHIGLAIAAIIHLLKHPKLRFGHHLLWILMIIFIQLFGSILYFTIGRGGE